MNEMRLPDHLDEREVLALMVEHARNAFLLIGPGRRALYANQAFLEMTGYEYDEWMAFERTSVLTADDDQVNTAQSLNRALQGDSTPFRPRSIVRSDGTQLWVEACVTVIVAAGERLLLAEFRPTTAAPPEGMAPWIAEEPEAA